MSFENVVLTYPQPHVVVYVEDNTTYVETFLAAEEPVKMIQCGAFSQGRDNRLIYCETYDEFISEFGEPNYKYYGQAGYNVARALKTEYAAAYVMRVMPEDATHANVVVSAKYKVVDDDSTKKLEIGYKTSYIQNAKSLEEMQIAFDELRTNAEEDDGYTVVPLFYIYQTGRGVYGNSSRIRLMDATAYDEPDNTFKCVRLDVLQMRSTLTRLESAYGTFDPDLYDAASKESLYLTDLVNDPEEGFTKVNIHINDAGIAAMLKVYNEQVATDAPETISTFDFIFGRDMKGKVNDLIKFTEDTVDLSETEGVSLYGGSDGAFAIDAEGREDAISAQLVNAYAGRLDKTITSRYTTPADFMLDANFDASVKNAMVTLALKREYDAMCYLDCGLLDTIDDVIAWGVENKNIYGYNVIKQCQHYKVRDIDYTGKTIDVTTTYYMAGLIPRHIKTRGLNEPMAMENALLTEAVKGSFAPTIDPDENDIKKELYNLRINWFETVRYNVYQRGVAITTQQATSDRMDEFNEYILHLAVAKATSILRSKIYKLGEEEDRANYTETANRELQYILGPMVRSVTVEFKMSADDERKSILRLALRIVYKTVIKRGIVEIYLDPRA